MLGEDSDIKLSDSTDYITWGNGPFWEAENLTGQEIQKEFPVFGGTKQILFKRSVKTEMNYISNKVK